jgi:hypothetical protein
MSSFSTSVNAVDIVTQGPNASVIAIYGSIQNSTHDFRAGDKIAVEVNIMWNPYVQPGSRLALVADSDGGFSVLNVQPGLPVAVIGQVGVCQGEVPQVLSEVVYLSAPAATYSGDLHLNLTFLQA